MLHYYLLANSGLTGTVPMGLSHLRDLGKICWENCIIMLISLQLYTFFVMVQDGTHTMNSFFAEILNLRKNKLNGTIPEALGLLQNLTWLELKYNNLGGEIPHRLFDAINLEALYLSHNVL